ncbi:AMP-binding protein, partial [Flavobacterium sp. FlaQc-51]
LDVEVPLEKNKRTIGQVKDCFIVTTQNFVSQAQQMQADATILVYDNSIINKYNKENHGLVLLGDSLSYIIFTSGSTGIPKGAMV